MTTKMNIQQTDYTPFFGPVITVLGSLVPKFFNKQKGNVAVPEVSLKDQELTIHLHIHLPEPSKSVDRLELPADLGRTRIVEGGNDTTGEGTGTGSGPGNQGQSGNGG